MSRDLFTGLGLGLLIGILAVQPIQQARADLSVSNGINGVATSVSGNVVGSVGSVLNGNSYAPQAIQSASVPIGTLGTTNVINVTESGEIIGVAITGATGTGSTSTAQLEIQIDGGTTAAYVFTNTTAGILALSTTPSPICTGSGTATLTCTFYTTYKTSARVGVNVTANNFTGNATLTVIRAVRS